MNFLSKTTFGLLFLTIYLFHTDYLLAQEYDDMDWRDRMNLLVYTPKYFGPNAFRIQELQSGRLSTRWEVELRGEYHYYTGDKTKNLFGRLYIPIADGKAGVEIRGVIVETYLMDKETQQLRNAVDDHPPITCVGDFIITAYYQILQSNIIGDVSVSGSLKTASGNRLCDARYTDAASYWFETTAGRDIFQTADKNTTFRLQGMIGFYCWMTNDMIHRQNDAILYGFGGSLKIKDMTLATNLSGFHGYKANGDRPVLFRSKLDYEVKKNIISLRYNHGIKDFLYDTYSVGIIRCF